MRTSRLYRLICSFDASEILKARQFLLSPYFNHRTDVVQLFEVLLEQKDSPPTKTAVARMLHPAQEPDLQAVRQVMSWLLKLLEKFLVVQDTLAADLPARVTLTRLLRERGLTTHFQVRLRETQKALDRRAAHTAPYYQAQYELMCERNVAQARQQRTAELSLQLQNDYLDTFYLLEKLRQACLLVSHQAVYNADYDRGFLDAILPLIDAPLRQQVPTVDAYYTCYRMLTSEGGDDHFFRLQSLLEQFPDQFPPAELRDLYLLSINYSIRRLNLGQTAFAERAFQLYRNCLAQGLLTLDGYISRFAYRNVVALGLDNKAFDWVEKFLEDYREQLAPAYRTPTYNFNVAKLAFAKKDYDTVILRLQEVEYQDILLNLAAKVLLLKVFYLQEEHRMLESQLSALQRFISRKKMIAYHRQNYRHIIVAFRLLHHTNAFDRAEKGKAIQTVEQLDPLTEKDWIIKQLQQKK